VDWNKDGKLDILSGCYWTDGSDSGHIQILEGKGPLEFASAESLTDADGNPLSNFEFDEDNKQAKQTETICTQQHAVDYDADGDLDLVVGCFANSFYYYENKADDGKPSLSKPVALPVALPASAYHAAPHLADWDGDGDLDLLSGSGHGGAMWSENTGTREKPEWSEFVKLIEPVTKSAGKASSDDSLKPASASRIWATDWNGDGKLDLLLGDMASIQKTGEKDRIDDLQKRMTESRETAKPLRAELRKLRKDGVKSDDEQIVDVRAQLAELSDVYLKLSRELRGSQTTERTGFVWLYIRSDASADFANADR